jgi:hypothetical protein
MPGLIRGVARTAVIAGTASAVGGRVNHRQQQKWAAQDQQQYAQEPPPQQYAPPPPAAPAPAESSEDDMFEQLKKLGELHEQGILTDEEFAAQKAKILG